MTIRTRPVTPEYEAGYERVFKQRILQLSNEQLSSMDEVDLKLKLAACGFDFTKPMTSYRDELNGNIVYKQ